MHAMGESSAELRLPTLTVPVDLARAGRAPERVELFLTGTPDRGRTAIAGEVAALLEADPAFLPVREPAAPGGPRVALVGKRAIVWVAVPLAGLGEQGDGGDDPLTLFDHDHGVRVELDVGDELAGHVFFSSPADRPRLIDHLNLPVHFLRLWTPDALFLINKHHVVRVVEVV
jgi:hypothetical protein